MLQKNKLFLNHSIIDTVNEVWLVLKETRLYYGLWCAMMRGRIVCIYTVSPQERGRELRRRPECMNIVSNHRDPVHVCETTRGREASGSTWTSPVGTPQWIVAD